MISAWPFVDTQACVWVLKSIWLCVRVCVVCTPIFIVLPTVHLIDLLIVSCFLIYINIFSIKNSTLSRSNYIHLQKLLFFQLLTLFFCYNVNVVLYLKANTWRKQDDCVIDSWSQNIWLIYLHMPGCICFDFLLKLLWRDKFAKRQSKMLSKPYRLKFNFNVLKSVEVCDIATR